MGSFTWTSQCGRARDSDFSKSPTLSEFCFDFSVSPAGIEVEVGKGGCDPADGMASSLYHFIWLLPVVFLRN